MNNINNSVLSKDTFTEAKNYTNINSILNSKARDTLTKMLLAPRKAMQMFANLEAAREVVKIFKQRHVIKLPDHIKTKPTFFEYKPHASELKSENVRKTMKRECDYSASGRVTA